MNHKMIQKKLLRYLDDELPEPEKVQVQQHLASCQSCRDVLRTVELLWQTERPIARETAPPFLWTRISARLQSEARTGHFEGWRKPLQWALRPVLTGVVLFFIVLSGIQLGNLMLGNSAAPAEMSPESTENFGMNFFEIAPPGSIDAHVLVFSESEIQE